MEGFFCEKLLGILVVLELVEELFWDKLLIKRGEFEEELEEEPLVEQLLSYIYREGKFCVDKLTNLSVLSCM